MSEHIEARGIVKTFSVRGSRAPVRAVNGVDIVIPRGRTLGLVGESGSGKSTVGRCLLRLLEPTEGTVRHGEHDVLAMKPETLRRHRARAAMVFQDPYESLNPRMRIRSVVEEPLMLHTDLEPSARRRRAAELMRLVRLEEFHLDRFPHELSGGQLQRIGIARALATDPEFLVLDEPTSSLDLSVRAGVLRLLKRLQRELGITFLFISHDLTTVAAMSDEVAVMYLGTVIEKGPAAEVLGNPQHPYSQALLSAALSVDPEGRRVRHVLEGETPSPVDLPPGCPLASRCPLVRNDCRLAVPPLFEVSEGHGAACVRVPEGTNVLPAVGPVPIVTAS
ncbi:ABC transporter ATP-binding protein [Nocardioides deserti]|uniref:ABC transporter ATP-binding protein n=1 Tax=Nocardioides deserti TaxID=1588644 RepID=A0ABR6UBH8_9ACTN|nr:ABC transporter ATP-binding protein [Nocardioides deserti]MBC2961730.1 ABC transporter ATP-binding protein [Nocardioides deserti]GGO73088.1 ABC transporter ATP-binding protein [Nocardioides deserti]